MTGQVHDALAFLRDRDSSLFLGPRPGKKSLGLLTDLKLTHCCTLLSEREDVRRIEKLCGKIGCRWIWLPIEGGRLEILGQVDLAGQMRHLAQGVGDEPQPRLYFHCSAGIHRTGFFVYAMLRLKGMNREQAFDELSRLRAVTAQQVGEERLDLADEMIAAMGAP